MAGANDSSLYVRRALVSGLAGLGVPVFGPSAGANSPVPRIQVGAVESEPFRSQCIEGSVFNVTIHSFHNGPDEQGVSDLNALVAERLDGIGRPLDAPYQARISQIRWLRSQIIRDTGDATTWHGVVSFRGTVVAE